MNVCCPQRSSIDSIFFIRTTNSSISSLSHFLSFLLLLLPLSVLYSVYLIFDVALSLMWFIKHKWYIVKFRHINVFQSHTLSSPATVIFWLILCIYIQLYRSIGCQTSWWYSLMLSVCLSVCWRHVFFARSHSRPRRLLSLMPFSIYAYAARWCDRRATPAHHGEKMRWDASHNLRDEGV